MQINVNKATIIQNKGNDVIILETSLPDPFGNGFDGRTLTLTIAAPPNTGLAYCQALGVTNQMIDVRTS